MSGSLSALRKDLQKQLKATFSADSTVTFHELTPPQHILDLVESYLSACKDASYALNRSTSSNTGHTASGHANAKSQNKERDDLYSDHNKLVDLLLDISLALPKTNYKHRRPGRVSAWLVILARLCTAHSEDAGADDAQLLAKEQIGSTLWPALLKSVLIPSSSKETHFVMGREGLVAAKSLLAWSSRKPDTGEAADLGNFERGLLEEYMALVKRPITHEIEDAKLKEKELKNLQEVICSIGHCRPKVGCNALVW